MLPDPVSHSRAWSVIRYLRNALPAGGSLPDPMWHARCRLLVGLTWLHAALIALAGPALGYRWDLDLAAFVREGTVLHAVSEGMIVAAFAAVATWSRAHRRIQAIAVAIGLMTASAILVHLSGGYIEFHFHFFVMLVFLALLQDWTPFLVAVAYVALHHGIVGVLWPEHVYNHPAALAAPWTWAAIHAFFVLWSCVGSVLAWRLNERVLARTTLILEAAGEGIFGVDQTGQITFMNRAAASMLRTSARRAVGRPVDESLQLLGADGTPISPDASPILAPLRDGRPRHMTEERFGRRDESTFPVDCRSTPIVEGDLVTGAVITFADMTERYRAEAALRDSEASYRGLVDGSLQGIYIEQDGTIKFVNRAGARICGYDAPDDLVGRSFGTFVAPAEVERVEASGQARLRGEPVPERFEVEGIRRDGAPFWADIQISASRWDGRPAILLACLDITERKRAEAARIEVEEQLRQSQKMDAVGRLAGGVAHDFNNLLTVITAQMDMALRAAAVSDPLRMRLQETKDAANRAAGLTRQLLAFSRKQILQPTVQSLNDIVEGLARMLPRLIGEDVDLSVALAPDLDRTQVDRGQVEQVMMNLVVNARDAMPDGGRFTIETGNVELDAAYVRQHPGVAPGKYVMLAVSDTGCGMDEATRSRIFEPFFTTKAPGQGTGLGLSTVYGIVAQSGGHVRVYSEPGHGTTFKVYFPSVEAEACEADEARSAGTPRGQETVLLVEDEAMVRRVAREILEDHGYTVLAASNGAEAVQAADQYAGPIHILLTDVIMPGMSGSALAARLTISRRAMKVLYMSGYTDGAVAHHGVLDPGVAYLEKPFSVDSLSTKVRDVLESEESGRGVGRVVHGRSSRG